MRNVLKDWGIIWVDNQKAPDEQNENGSNLGDGVEWLLIIFSSVFLKPSSSHGLDSCELVTIKTYQAKLLFVNV